MVDMTNQAVLPAGNGRVHLADLPMPQPPRGCDVLVRMLRAPINPADLLVIEGRYAFSLGADAPIGAEGVGVVEAAGEGSSDLSPGDMVLVLSRGNWCRYRLVPRSDLIALPDGCDPAQGAMMRINPPTARLLIEAAAVGAGDVILQNAAGSTVATWVRLIASRMALTVIDIVRCPDAALPHAIVDGPGLAERVKAATAGLPVRAALDCVAGGASGRLAQCLAPSGRLIVFGHLSGDPVSVPSQLLTGGGLTIQGFSLRPAETALGVAERNARFADLFALSASAQLRLPLRETVPLSRIDEGVALARIGGRGRVMIDLTT